MIHQCRHLAFFISLLSLFLLSCSGSEPQKGREVRRLVLPAGEVHEGWYFAGGDQVVIQGTINGDAYVAAATVDVEGTVNGDLIVAGGQVVVRGIVSDDVRAAGGSVRLSGKVGKNVTVVGGQVYVERGSKIDGGLLAAGGTVQIDGTIAKDVMVSAGDVGMAGSVGGNVSFTGGRFEAVQGASVGGSLTALVDEEGDVVVPDQVVNGKVDITTGRSEKERTILGYGAVTFWLKVVWACGLVIMGGLLTFASPRFTAALGTTIATRPGATALWGFLGLVLVPIVILILCITIIGIPIGLLVLTIYLWLLYVSELSLGVLVGKWLGGVEGKQGWALFWPVAAGIVIVQILMFIPYVRAAVIIAALVFGLGAWLVGGKQMLASKSAA